MESGTIHSAGEAVAEEAERYAPAAKRPPLLTYAGIIAAFNAVLAALLVRARRRGRLPERVPAGEILLVGIASHKLSRLIAKDKVTAPLRAPFTELEGEAGPAELSEKPRGAGARKAVGELIGCPYCLGMWAATAFSVGLLHAPRTTRFLASIMAALAISDFLQIAYKAAEEKGLE